MNMFLEPLSIPCIFILLSMILESDIVSRQFCPHISFFLPGSTLIISVIISWGFRSLALLHLSLYSGVSVVCGLIACKILDLITEHFKISLNSTHFPLIILTCSNSFHKSNLIYCKAMILVGMQKRYLSFHLRTRLNFLNHITERAYGNGPCPSTCLFVLSLHIILGSYSVGSLFWAKYLPC